MISASIKVGDKYLQGESDEIEVLKGPETFSGFSPKKISHVNGLYYSDNIRHFKGLTNIKSYVDRVLRSVKYGAIKPKVIKLEFKG